MRQKLDVEGMCIFLINDFIWMVCVVFALFSIILHSFIIHVYIPPIRYMHHFAAGNHEDDFGAKLVSFVVWLPSWQEIVFGLWMAKDLEVSTD